MSPTSDKLLAKRVGRVGALVAQLGLVAIWILLWGQLDWMTLLTGIIIAIVVGQIFYLPPVDFGGRFSLWHFTLFMSRMLIDIFIASIQVAWLAMNWRYTPKNAIIELDLHTHNDLIMTWTVESISLVPGTIVVEADREKRRLFLHILHVTTPQEVEKIRRHMQDTEARLTLAFGTHEEVRQLRAERQNGGGLS
ncbi:Na+/H+ antiporter subunit E [Lysinibacter sp. HNR]|uniref:Na+/H+ antiporter subunit E n=1 Tax=Lysinibacter sp. HNR TaxID=3031408 RepID=UPI0024352033|nr:Na+/H+ antiporter subunit E [Lysinibacter sp. HNR]WGD36946.1 Na+/H+ antiporter subunit E [Lysinibacter sp. HNR]